MGEACCLRCGMCNARRISWLAGMSTHREATKNRAGMVVALLAPIVLLAAGCSGGSPGPGVAGGGSSSASTSASQSALAFSQCMRSHGVPDFPDPSNGVIPKRSAQQLGVSTSTYEAASRACAHLAPNNRRLTRQQLMSAMGDFASCMRSHGVANWPYPDADSDGWPIFYLQNRIEAYSPQILARIRTCRDRVPADSAVRLPPGSPFPGGVRICPGERPNDWRNGDDCDSLPR